MMTENNQNIGLKNPEKMNKRSRLYMFLIIACTIISLICISIIAGIWYWLYSTNNIGREEQKGLHIAIFILCIIDVVFMALWVAAMVANIVIFKKMKVNNQLRFLIHYIGVVSCHIIFGCVAFALFVYCVTWKIMDEQGRKVAMFFVGFLEILRLCLLASVLVTSIIYLRRSKNGQMPTQKWEVKSDKVSTTSSEPLPGVSQPNEQKPFSETITSN